MVKLYFNGEWFDTNNKKDNVKLKHYYNYSLESRNNLIIALGLALVKEQQNKKEVRAVPPTNKNV